MSSFSPSTNNERKQVKSFEDIWELIRKISLVSGVLFLPGITKNVWMQRILMFNAPLSFGIVLILAYGTFELNEYSLMFHILVHSILINFGTIFYGFSCVIRNKTNIVGFMDWCRSLYNYQKKFHPVQHEIVKPWLGWVHTWATRVIQVTATFFWADAFVITFGFAFVGQFLPKSIYPKYSAPLPYYFPFEDQKNWTSFVITLLSQFKCSLDLASFHLIMLCILYTIPIHIYAYLNIVKETIEFMGEKLQSGYDRKMQGDINGRKPHGNLAHRNNQAMEGSSSQIDDLSLDSWIKLTVDMISESNEILSTFGQIFTGYFFLFELTSFGALFIFGMVMLVIHQQYFFAFGVGSVSFVLLSFCFMNEKLLEKFAQISDAMYNIPWYAMTPKQRKILLQMMTCSNIQKGFMASRIHGVTLERFNKIVQAAYSNALVLKDLVMKF